uniref:Putative early secreted salivary protein n=1 Tax=Ixodes scapularis TaxID=6945 RepID=Q4PN49_IXOSC|nr:putative early secreted salivary protein [Ixodes scapularis]
MKATIAVLCVLVVVACSLIQVSEAGRGPIMGGSNPSHLPGLEGGGAGAPASQIGEAGAPLPG